MIGQRIQMTETIDALAAELFPPDEPGAAVALGVAGETVYRKGFGLANLEHGIKIEPEMVFRVGSLTKQFTALSILMLVEQGRLSLSEDFRTYLPDYPKYESTVTIEHLLTHTSGVPSYTGFEDWPSIYKKDMTVDELIDYFKSRPLVFSPGEKYQYSNSGYILLGAIIEKITACRYADFIREKIFEPLGMRRSIYDSSTSIVPGRVYGYQTDGDRFYNADYLSMTQPFSAGGLASTVDDLMKWDNVLYTERLVSRSLLEKAFTPYRLLDGTISTYGYGWQISESDGYKILEHSGTINGFAAQALRIPHKRIFVAILSNNQSKGAAIKELAHKIAHTTV